MTACRLIGLGLAVIVCLSLAAVATPQSPTSLCEQGEKVIFSCAIKKPAKILSFCSSANVSKQQGYVQYRFGLPGKIELEFPKTRVETQQAFKYSHYFRAQVDETEISFSSENYQYAIFDDYYGDENPAIHQQGVRVTAPDGKETTLSCSGRAKADYGNLSDVLPSEPR